MSQVCQFVLFSVYDGNIWLSFVSELSCLSYWQKVYVSMSCLFYLQCIMEIIIIIIMPSLSYFCYLMEIYMPQVCTL